MLFFSLSQGNILARFGIGGVRLLVGLRMTVVVEMDNGSN